MLALINSSPKVTNTINLAKLISSPKEFSQNLKGKKLSQSLLPGLMWLLELANMLSGDAKKTLGEKMKQLSQSKFLPVLLWGLNVLDKVETASDIAGSIFGAQKAMADNIKTLGMTSEDVV